MKFFSTLWLHIAGGAGQILNQLFNKNLFPALDFIGHALLGAVVGFVLPSIQQAIQAYLSTPGASISFLFHPAGLVPILVSATIGGLLAAGKNSPISAVNLLAGNVTPAQAANAASIIDAKVLAAIPVAKPVTVAPVKTAMFFISLLLLTASAFATNPIGVPLNPPVNGEDDLLFMPFTNVNAYTVNTKTNYGLGVAWGLAFANVQPNSATSVDISPYAFFAPYASVEIANWINTQGQSPLSVDYGIMVGLPQLDSAVPEIGFTVNWNSLTGNTSTLGIVLAFPTDILSDALVRKINL